MSKGEQAMIDFFVFMNEVYEKSFSLRIKQYSVTIIQSFMTQFFGHPDKEMAKEQQHERNKLAYQPINPSLVTISEELKSFISQFIEHIAVAYSQVLN
jgi:hypothetical protein